MFLSEMDEAWKEDLRSGRSAGDFGWSCLTTDFLWRDFEQEGDRDDLHSTRGESIIPAVRWP